jgi:hypothetical protein
MPYPPLIQFETLDNRRRRALGIRDEQSRAAVARAEVRPRGALLGRLRRRRRPAAGAI